jgi:hypothetical protein
VPRTRSAVLTLFYLPESRRYGFRYHFEGYDPHHVIDTCQSIEDALNICDPHREHVWEKPAGGDENVLFVSRQYKEGSVMWRMAHLTLPELGAQRSADNRA